MKKLQTPLKLSHQFWRYYHEISTQTYHFNRHQVEASILRDLKLENLLEFFDSHISTSESILTPNSSIISIHVVAPKSEKSKNDDRGKLMDFRYSLPLNQRPTRIKNLRKFYSKKL